VAVRNLKRAADSGAEPYVLTDDPWKVVEGPAETIIETIGGLEPAQALVEAALNAGKHVVTANKTLLATCGEELEVAGAAAGRAAAVRGVGGRGRAGAGDAAAARGGG
jgi:homoserine dehydrogenase